MFLKSNIYKQIYKQIKNYDTIVLAHHRGPDPDALGSCLGLKQIILDNFKEKTVYAIGSPVSRFSYMGNLDKLPEDLDNKKVLLIVTDTPDHKRVDGVDPRNFPNSIKIDHHPFVEKICKLEWIDDSASSASQMILEMVLNTKLQLSKEAAEKLFVGIVADTGRFLFSYSSPKTFNLVSKMLEITNIDITKMYEKLYLRDYKEVKFQGYMYENYQITENNVGYIIIDDETLKKFNVDAGTPGNIINEFNYINEMLIWVTATLDKNLDSYRISIRSRGPVINKVAADHGGGGHIYSSGTRLKTISEINELIKDLDKVALEYKKNL